MKIVFITTEVAPWSKVGGLADVMGALPEALAARGHQTMTVSPRYRALDELEPTGLRVPLDLPVADPDMQRWAGLHRITAGGVAHMFVEHPLFCAGESIYATAAGPSAGVTTYSEASNNGAPGVELQYSVLCQVALAAPLLVWALDKHRDAAALQAPARAMLDLDLTGRREGGARSGALGLDRDSVKSASSVVQPCKRELMQAATELAAGEPTVFVANDWPATLALLRLRYCVRLGAGMDDPAVGQVAGDSAPGTDAVHETLDRTALARALRVGLRRAVGALCIHNLAYQGVLPASAFEALGLPEHARAALAAEADWKAVLDDLAARDAEAEARAEALRRGVCPTGECAARRPTPPPLGSAATPATPGSPLSQGPGASMLTLARPTAAGRGAGHRAFATGAGAPDGELSSASSTTTTSATTSASSTTTSASSATTLASVTTPSASSTTPTAPPGSALNLMRGGVLTADGVITVSPGYAQEVVANAHFGCGLDGPLAARGVSGVLNGLDTKVWDPATDAQLPRGCRYGPGPGARAGKAAAKAALQARLGLRIDADAPLFSFVGRLTQQKGVDVLLAALPALMAGKAVPAPGGGGRSPAGTSSPRAAATKPPIQVAMLGMGETWMEEALKGLDQSFPGQAAGVPMFSEELAHWLMAGSDFVLVPSRFEPCGLVAPCAMHYGALPVVARTGGLQDMVNERVGFTLPRLGSEASAVEVRQDVLNLVNVMQIAAAQYGSPGHAKKMAACMVRDVSWAVPAVQWEAWFQTLII